MAKMLINGKLHDKPAPNDGRFVRLSGGLSQPFLAITNGHLKIPMAQS